MEGQIVGLNGKSDRVVKDLLDLNKEFDSIKTQIEKDEKRLQEEVKKFLSSDHVGEAALNGVMALMFLLRELPLLIDSCGFNILDFSHFLYGLCETVRIKLDQAVDCHKGLMQEDYVRLSNFFHDDYPPGAQKTLKSAILENQMSPADIPELLKDIPAELWTDPPSNLRLKSFNLVVPRSADEAVKAKVIDQALFEIHVEGTVLAVEPIEKNFTLPALVAPPIKHTNN